MFEEKSFPILEGAMNTFWEPKDQKGKKLLNISKKVFFIAFSKFYDKHRNYEILSKSLVPTVGTCRN